MNKNDAPWKGAGPKRSGSRKIAQIARRMLRSGSGTWSALRPALGMQAMVLSPDDRALRFDQFTLDLRRCVLLRGSDALPLRPKSFDVLLELALNRGQVVNKEHLFETVWPDVTVTDDSLVQCIKEIRKVLGADGRHLVGTIPKRGYILNAHVVASGDTEGETAAPIPDVAGGHGDGLGAPSHETDWGWAAPLRRLSARATGALIAAMVLAIALLAFTARPVHLAPNANAAHYAIMGTSVLDQERSQQANLKALALFDKALALDPDQALALVGYARVIITDVTEGWVPTQEREVRLTQAETALTRVLSKNQGDGRAHHIYGLLWRARGDAGRAISELEQALRLRPTKGWVMADLGRAKLEAGHALEALRDLEAAIRMDPDEPFIGIWYFQAGMAAVHAADGEVGLRWFDRSEAATALYRRQIKLWRAVALVDAGRGQEAAALIEEYRGTSPHVTVASWLAHFPNRNAAATTQRLRIADVLRRLGIPAGDMHAGLPQ